MKATYVLNPSADYLTLLTDTVLIVSTLRQQHLS